MHNGLDTIILPFGIILINHKTLTMIRVTGSDDAVTCQAFCDYATKCNYKCIDLCNSIIQ